VRGRVIAVHDVLQNPATGFSIQVEDTCNASNVTVLLWPPSRIPRAVARKGQGTARRTLLLHGVNLLRIAPLLHRPARSRHVRIHSPLRLEGVIMLVTLVIFWTWVQRTYRASQP